MHKPSYLHVRDKWRVLQEDFSSLKYLYIPLALLTILRGGFGHQKIHPALVLQLVVEELAVVVAVSVDARVAAGIVPVVVAFDPSEAFVGLAVVDVVFAASGALVGLAAVADRPG